MSEIIFYLALSFLISMFYSHQCLICRRYAVGWLCCTFLSTLNVHGELSLHPQEGIVLDTISWDPVEELDRVGINCGHEVLCLDWSQDGYWLVVSSRDGVTLLIDPNNWEVVQRIEYFQESDRASPKGEVFFAAGKDKVAVPVGWTEENQHTRQKEEQISMGQEGFGQKNVGQSGDSEFTEHLRDIMTCAQTMVSDLQIKGSESTMSEPLTTEAGRSTYIANVPSTKEQHHKEEGCESSVVFLSMQSPVVWRFLGTTDDFLSPYEHNDSPHQLRLFVPLVLMLRVHVLWVMTVDKGTLRVLEQRDRGRVFGSFIAIVTSISDIMDRVMVNRNDVEKWWDSVDKFCLSTDAMDHMEVWNNAWKAIESDAPIVDMDFLKMMDSKISEDESEIDWEPITL